MNFKDENLNQKWTDYNQMRLAGNKKSANQLLNDFINSLLLQNEEVRESFVYEICNKVLKNNILDNNGTEVSEEEIRIQHPLFSKIIVPVLIKKHNENNPLYIRWIAQFEQFFYADNVLTTRFLKAINDDYRKVSVFSKEHNEYVTEKHQYFSTESFLKKSFAIEPNPTTLELLLKILAKKIDFQTHELPYIVLLDANEFEKEIEEFEFYWNKSTEKEKWSNALKYWQEISEHWKNYSIHKNDCTSFEEYLKRENTKIK